MIDTPCTQEGCQVGSTGKCVEGFDPPSTCLYLTSSSIPDAGAETPAQPAFVDLPKGEALTEVQASDVTREGPTRVVVLAGPIGSGKTTIITSLFEAFLEAPFANFLFAGSLTLVGFEKRCHDARMASERAVPHTIRTPVTNAVEFLHLQLVSASPTLLRRQNLLLSDISGERFRALRDSSDAVSQMKMLGRADHLCIVVDGKKLSDAAERHAARTDARMLLRSLIESKSLSPNCEITIVFSKWDLVLANENQQSLLPFIEETKANLKKQANGVASLKFVEIAARPENRKLPFAFGLPTLLRSWLEEPALSSRARLYMTSVDNDTREISRFGIAIAKTQRLGEVYDVLCL
jgi:GTPase SAR1 family protein